MKISDWFGSIDTGEPPTYKLSGNQRIAELEAELQEARRLLKQVAACTCEKHEAEIRAFLGGCDEK